MVSVQVSPSEMRDIPEQEEQEAQQLASKMLRPGGSYAKYSQYASTQNVRQRLLYLWNKQGAREVVGFEKQKAGTFGQYYETPVKPGEEQTYYVGGQKYISKAPTTQQLRQGQVPKGVQFDKFGKVIPNQELYNRARSLPVGAPISVESIKKSYIKAPSQKGEVPLTKAYESPITARAIGESVSDYNKRVSEAYEKSLKESKVRITYGFGDTRKGLSIEDIQMGGYSKITPTGEKEIYVNWIGSLFYGGAKQVIKHEYGHILGVTSLFGKPEDYKASAGGVLDITNVGYPKEQLSSEYKARSFSLFIDNPEEFKKKYPGVAGEFEGVLGIGYGGYSTLPKEEPSLFGRAKSFFGLTGGVVGVKTTAIKIQGKEQPTFLQPLSERQMLEKSGFVLRQGVVLPSEYSKVKPSGIKLTPFGQKLVEKGLININEQREEKFSPYAENVSYGRLIKEGQLQTIPRKLAGDVAVEYFKKVGEIGGFTPLSTKQEQKVREIGGYTLLFGAFSPFMKTGTYSEDISQNPFESLFKKKKTAQALLQESKYSGLGAELSREQLAESVISKVGKELVTKKTTIEQIKYLSKLANNIKTAQDKEVFRSLVAELYNRGIFKGFPNEFYTGGVIKTITPTKTEALMDILARDLPNLRGVSTLSSSISVLTGTTIKEVSGKVKQPTKQSILISEALGLSLPTKQIQPSLSILRTTQQEVQKEKQVQPQPSLLFQSPITKQIQRTIQRQVTKQITKQIPRQAPKLKVPTPKINLLDSAKGKKRIELFEKFILYTPEVRRRGKWFALKPSITLFGARQQAERFISGTLGAAFRVKKGKELIELRNLGRTLAPSKRERRTYIQIKTTRLGQKSEVSEIQSALKGKKSKRRFKWF